MIESALWLRRDLLAITKVRDFMDGQGPNNFNQVIQDFPQESARVFIQDKGQKNKEQEDLSILNSHSKFLDINKLRILTNRNSKRL